MTTPGLTVAVFLVLIGAVIGSFVNLCIDRIPRAKSILISPSHCDSCGRRLGVLELVPIVSIIALRFRCRTCGTAIPKRVLMVEVMLAGAGAYLGYRYGLSITSLVLGLYLAVLTAVFFIDIERGIIPNKIVIPASVAGIGFAFLMPEVGFSRALIGGAVGFGIMLVIYVVSRGGMGGGDVKLAGFIGIATGFPLVVPALMIAAISGGLIAMALLVARKRGRQDRLPFGPMLALGAVISLLADPSWFDLWTPGL